MEKIIRDVSFYSTNWELETSEHIPENVLEHNPENKLGKKIFVEATVDQHITSIDQHFDELSLLDHELVQAIREAGL